MNPKANSLKWGLPYFLIALIVTCLATFLLHNVGNLNYPLSGEFLTSPFHGEILKRSLNVWDERFGLGFSNLLNSSSAAPYAAAYSGAMWVSNNVLNAFFQFVGNAFFINQVVSLLLLTVGVYGILTDFRPNSRNVVVAVFLSVAISAIIHSADMFTDSAGSAGRFVAGQGLMLIAFLQYRNLLRSGFCNIYSINSLIPLVLSLSTLLLIFNPYFLALMLMIGIQGVVEYVLEAGKRVRVVIDYAKLLAIFITLILVIYGYVVAPPFLSAANTLMSGMVGRHDSPMAYSLINVLRFGNNPIRDSFGWAGIWLQFGLALLGIILAMFSSRMKRWVGIDLFVIIIFLFLSKGSATPFPEINHWLHVNIPFLRMMGSGYSYFGVIYTLLIYYLIFGICSFLGAIEKKLPRVGEYIGFALITVVLVVAIFRNDAYLSGDFGGRVQSIEYPGEYYDFKQIAERDMQIGRSYYFPDEGAQIGSDYKFSPAHPLGCCFDLPFSSVFPININWSNFNNNTSYSGYYGQTMAFLMKHSHSGDEIAHILTAADTKYAVFDMSLKQTSSAAERMLAVKDQVRTSKSFEFRSALSNRYLEVYENKQWRPFSLETQSITLGTDDPSIFLMAAKAGTSLAKDSIVVSGAITLSKAMELKGNNNLSKILLYNSDERGLMLDMIRTRYEIKPDANFLSSDGQSWYTNNRGYQFQHTERYGGRFIGQYPIAAISDGVRVSYRAKILPHIKNRLFVRALVSPNSGRVGVYVNGEKRLLNLHSSEYVGIQWFDLGDVISLTGKADIEIESLDAGQAKVIDVLSLIPEKQLIESLEMMRNLFSGIQIDRVEKADYLRWKQTNAADDLKMATAQDGSQIKPKRITIARQHFKLHDDFDHFGDGAGGGSINLAEQEYAENISLGPSAKDRNFLRTYNGIQHGFVASADIGAGTYSLEYELLACQPFSELTLNLRTAYVSAASPLYVYVSNNASTWAKIETRTSDEEGNKVLDLSEFARGKKKIYIKMSYEKLKEVPGSIYLMDLVIRGMAGKENMNCESPPVVESKNESHFPRSKPDGGLLFPKVGGAESLQGKPTGKSVIVINKAFDPNWRMDGAHPFNINYGFSAFVTDDANPFHEPIHGWQDKYRILLFCSLGVYLFLWFALIWNSYRRERHGV